MFLMPSLSDSDRFVEGLFILNDKLEPVAPESFVQWAEWRMQADETGGRIMLRSTFEEGAYVSSVFLGWAFEFSSGTPLYFETMLFDGPGDWSARASTLNDLILNHKVGLALVARALHVSLDNVKHEGRLCISTEGGLRLPQVSSLSG